MSAVIRISKLIRKELINSVIPHAGETVALALSGGVDSCSILAAMLSADLTPVVVSYTPETHESTDFLMAQAAADRHGLKFVPAIVSMHPRDLEATARKVISLGYSDKVAVECLSPVVHIAAAASSAGARVLFTGDQADGFFCLSKWASHNADRAAGIPRGQRTNVQQDSTPERIDHLRERYWKLDKSCSRGVQEIGIEEDVQVVIPYRNYRLFSAFQGSLWSEINKPRPKEPIRLAFEKELQDIPTRRLPVNLHKGDSEFAKMMGERLLAHLPGWWRTTTGLYHAMARGEV